jgi:hypothetical protein
MLESRVNMLGIDPCQTYKCMGFLAYLGIESLLSGML